MSRFLTNVWRRGLLLASLPLAMAGEVRADEVTDWHEHTLVALGEAGVNPIVSTREAALVSAAVFDAVNGIERRYAPIHVGAAAPKGASKRAAAVQAAYVILVSRFPAQADDLSAKLAASMASLGGEEGESVRRGVEWGQAVAQAILDWRSGDGFTLPLPPFLGGDEPGRWRPTSPDFEPGAVPQFATMTPWGIESPDQFRPLGPPALDSQQYHMDLIETKLMGSATSALRTDDETDACFFWGSASATHVWNLAAIDLAKERSFELSENARLLATLNLAIADGLIASWDAKYTYEFWRPITAIRLHDADGDGNPDDPEWEPLLQTPPFPEYTAGHSCVAGAAAAVLSAYFGEDTPFFLESQAAPNWIRSYPNFSTALAEVDNARIFAGVHFRTGCEVGTVAGSEVATYILENRMRHNQGKGE
jgi:hypothetical protein